MPKTKKTSNSIDKSIRSLEAENFYSDYQTEETLHAVLIRSPAPTGKIKSISIDNLPEGYFLYTSQQIPGSKSIKINDTDLKIFGYDSVSYTGEPLGILVGPDEKILKNLSDNVNVDFQVQSLESALKNVIKKERKDYKEIETGSQDFSDLVDTLNDMPSLDTVIDRTHIDSNVEKVIARRIIKTGLFSTEELETAEKIFFSTENSNSTEENPENNESEKYLVSENRWSISLQAPGWIETCGAFCYIEEDLIHVYTPTRWTYLVMKSISQVLDVPFENVIIHKTNTSGIFSKGLWRTTILAVQVAVAAYLTNKPVKLVYTQSEQDLFLKPGVQAEFTYKTAITKSGEIVANKIDVNVDVGSANPFAQEITDRFAIASNNYYVTKNLYINVTAHTSKNPPSSINIKSVCAPAFFAVENQMESLCKLTDLFPLELRKINTQQKNVVFPFQININDYEKAFENTLKISDFNRKYCTNILNARKRAEKENKTFFALPVRGIGISSAYNNSGYYGSSSFSYSPKISVTLEKDNKVIIHSIKPSEEVEEIWKTTVSEILEIKKDNISVDSYFHIDDLPESPEDSFSTIGNINEALKKCCNDIQKRRFHQPLPLESNKSISLKKEWDKDNFTGNPYGTTAFAAIAVEVELDPYTYNEKIKGIWITIDCGELLNEVSATRKIRLEVQQILSMLVEGKTIPYDNLTINFIESDNKSGQIGELIQNALPAAFSSALSQALATHLTQLPCTEKQLYKLIKEQKIRNANKANENEPDNSSAADSSNENLKTTTEELNNSSPNGD